MEINTDPRNRISPELAKQLVGPDPGVNFRKARKEDRERRGKEVQDRKPNQTPSERDPRMNLLTPQPPSSVLSKEQREQLADKGLKQAIHGLTNWRDHKPKY